MALYPLLPRTICAIGPTRLALRLGPQRHGKSPCRCGAPRARGLHAPPDRHAAGDHGFRHAHVVAPTCLRTGGRGVLLAKRHRLATDNAGQPAPTRSGTMPGPSARQPRADTSVSAATTGALRPKGTPRARPKACIATRQQSPPPALRRSTAQHGLTLSKKLTMPEASHLSTHPVSCNWLASIDGVMLPGRTCVTAHDARPDSAHLAILVPRKKCQCPPDAS